MKFAFCFASLLLASVAWADATSDRAAIESVISRLNDGVTPVSTLFASDAVDNPTKLVQLVRLNRSRTAANQPLSEVSDPKTIVHSIQFITPEIALVDANNAQFGSQIMRSLPTMFVMKRQGDDWRIAAYRIISAPPPLPTFSQQLL